MTEKQIHIKQVGGGFIVEVEGKMITQEIRSIMGSFSQETPRMHQFVFSDIYAMFVFLHNFFYPTAEAVGVRKKGKAPESREEHLSDAITYLEGMFDTEKKAMSWTRKVKEPK